MDTTAIGNKIKHARDTRNVTLDDIALKVGVAKSTIQRYEAGKIETPKLPVLEAIAKALEVNPAWLVGKSEEMNPVYKSVPKILECYNALNDIGKHEATKRVEELTHIPIYKKHLEINAAHERTDVGITDDMKQHDDKIMDDENF